jgi:phage N-6-adenine-methyltransferase
MQNMTQDVIRYDHETGEVLSRYNGNGLISLPDPIELSPVGLTVNGEVAYEDWAAFGETLQRVEGSINWWIGDWINYGERKYGEAHTQAMEATGKAYTTIANCAWVASKIDFSRRRENLSWSHHMEIAKCEPDEQLYWLDRAEKESWSVAELRRMMKQQPWLSSESNEWYTPPQYVEAARAVLGHFDVDPASNDTAQQIIRAETYYTAETNGLDKDWPGKVWLNPPYGGLSGPFAKRLVEQFEAGIVEEAVLLVNANSTDTNWFSPLWDYTLCFTDHRIDFQNPEGSRNGSTHGSVFIYLGENERAFYDHFSPFGCVVKRLRYE